MTDDERRERKKANMARWLARNPDYFRDRQRRLRAERERWGVCVIPACRDRAAPGRKRCESHLRAERVKKAARKKQRGETR